MRGRRAKHAMPSSFVSAIPPSAVPAATTAGWPQHSTACCSHPIDQSNVAETCNKRHEAERMKDTR